VSSGYVQPSWYGPEEQELAAKQARVEVSNRWAQCARENGYPALRDVDTPVADSGTSWPAIILPADITEGQLVTLVEACPVVEPGADLPEDVNEALLQIPSIAFDAPFFDGRPFAEPPTAEEYARVPPLIDVVYAGLEEHFGEGMAMLGYGFSIGFARSKVGER
jgi:hypothetical protein